MTREHEQSILQRAEMRRGEHPNGTYDGVKLPPLIGTPQPVGRDDGRRMLRAQIEAMEAEKVDRIASAYYDQWPENMKYQHSPTFADVLPSIQHQIRQEVRMFLTAVEVAGGI